MLDSIGWKSQFQAEIDHAMQARSSGYIGMSRVCARRAVSILLCEYLTRFGYPTESHPSIYDWLQRFISLPHLTPQMRETATNFLLRVNPDHTLPGNPDLIALAEWMATELMGQKE